MRPDAPSPTHISATPSDTALGVLAGLAVGPENIRAGLFDPSLHLLSRTKLSTKPERGPKQVLERIARCVRYAIDDADLQPQQVSGVGIGVPGDIDVATGLVHSAPTLGWTSTPLQEELEQRISLPVRAGNSSNLAALAIHHLELGSAPGTFAVLFVAQRVGLAVIRAGAWLDLSAPSFAPLQLEAPRENVFRTLPTPGLTRLRSRDLRAAWHRHDAAARRFMAELVDATVDLAGRVQAQIHPARFILAGGIVDEMHEEILAELRPRLDSVTVPLATSTLGKKATMAGAAAWAAAPPDGNALPHGINGAGISAGADHRQRAARRG